MASQYVKIIVYVPESHADTVRAALGNAGAGAIGNYSHCSYSSKGIGRFKPGQRANPHIGEIGKIEEVVEDRIETVCERQKLSLVVSAMKEAHPYEEVAYDVYALEPA